MSFIIWSVCDKRCLPDYESYTMLEPFFTCSHYHYELPTTQITPYYSLHHDDLSFDVEALQQRLVGWSRTTGYMLLYETYNQSILLVSLLIWSRTVLWKTEIFSEVCIQIRWQPFPCHQKYLLMPIGRMIINNPLYAFSSWCIHSLAVRIFTDIVKGRAIERHDLVLRDRKSVV